MDALDKITQKFPELKFLVHYGARERTGMEKPISASVILDETLYADEPIVRPRRDKSTDLPDLLARARELEGEDMWAPRHEIFMKQGRLLADYADDFPYSGDPVRYYPTYQSLTDQELRGYFTWRPKARAGIADQAPLTFIYLYIYELINLIGVESPEAAYERLLFMERSYSGAAWSLRTHLGRWLRDFVVYYNLDPDLLSDSADDTRSQNAQVLMNIGEEPDERIIGAVRLLAPKWLGRSRFYAAHFEDMDKVVCDTLRGMAAHYAKNCKRGLAEQFFGSLMPRHMHIFGQAIFTNPLNRQNYEYSAGSQVFYKCENGIWTTSRLPLSSSPKLEDFLKTVDQIMREEWDFGFPIKGPLTTRWIVKLIRENAAALLAEKTRAEKSRIAMDFSALAKIRSDAAITQERLASVEEEAYAEPEGTLAAAREESRVQSSPAGLTQNELRLLKCLLAGEDTSWLRKEGLLFSVLADAINEKLYDNFEDTVLDDDGLVPDYVEDLKEIALQ